MKMRVATICAVVKVMLAMNGGAQADIFGTGDNQFTIDFVPISGSTNPTSGIPAGKGFTFTGVNNDYRMGKFEITNAQWDKFKAAYGTVTGNPLYAYDADPYWTDESVPTNMTSWYEAAQFVNYLNTSKGYQAAYKFTCKQGFSFYQFGVWQSGDVGYNASNPYRNSNAFYFLPTENEWVKAAYWNGTALQTYATKAGESLYQGNGSNGGWNYNSYAPWAVGIGSRELNGTYDMMGNVQEWMESPCYSGDYFSGNYLSGSSRGIRGGSYYYSDQSGLYLASSIREGASSNSQGHDIGFRVASVPEPATILFFAFSGIFLHSRNKFSYYRN